MQNGISFQTFGVMVDCSRNAVMTVSALKKFITVIARMGYNQVHLYMEDTYEVEQDPYFGYLRGRYTKQELKELDDFAYQFGIELVPNIQTLAHMNAFVRWHGDFMDIDDIMLVGDEKVYDLISRMFKSLRECFRTDNIHIGMDEAVNLGRGKYYDLHGSQNRFDILLSHLQRVCDIAGQYNFKPMLWSDMFYRIASNGNYYESNSKFNDSIKNKIPQNATLVYWDYYSHDRNKYKKMIKGHHQLCNNVVFAGGAWKWSGFAPNNYFSIKATKASFSACKEENVRDVFLTMWGDNGAECSSFSVLPTLCYAACLAKGITKLSDIRDKFKEWVGVRYEDFMLLDCPNRIIKTHKVINPAKYFLYADCFMSLYQNIEKEEYAAIYAQTARKLKRAAQRAGEYAYLFETLAALCDVLTIKSNICSRTRGAYQSGDLGALSVIRKDYKKMIKKTQHFYNVFRTQWYTENKPHGFDVQDIRLGGLMQRIKSCAERLDEYCEGKISCIEELEEKINHMVEIPVNQNQWQCMVTTNLI